MAPTNVWAKGVSSSEMNVTWEPVQQDMNGILLGYEVSVDPGAWQRQGAGAARLGRGASRLTRPSSWDHAFSNLANSTQVMQHCEHDLS